MESHDDLTCQELVELVTDYLEGALPAGDRRRFDVHLSDCPGCAVYLDQMKATVTTLGQLSADDIPAGACDELLAAFRGWRTTPGRN